MILLRSCGFWKSYYYKKTNYGEIIPPYANMWKRRCYPGGSGSKNYQQCFFSNEFLIEWNGILSDCSTQLINLIIKYEEPKISLLSEEVKKAEQDIQEFKDITFFDDEYKKLKENVDKYEEWIASIKQNKFRRDLFDYAHNQVYTWKNREKFCGNSKSILKKPNYNNKHRQKIKNPHHIHFSSSSSETAGESTDPSEDGGMSDTRSGGSSQCSYIPSQSKSNKSANT